MEFILLIGESHFLLMSLLYGAFPLIRARCHPGLCPTAMPTRIEQYSGSQVFPREGQEALDWDSSWIQVTLGDVRLHKKWTVG